VPGRGTVQFTHMKGDPVRVRELSNHRFYNEATKQVEVIRIKHLSCGSRHLAGTRSQPVNQRRAGCPPESNRANHRARACHPPPTAVLDTEYADTPAGAGGQDVYMWGFNGNGELNNGSRAAMAVPKPVRCVLARLKESAVLHGFALTTTGARQFPH